MVCIYTLLILSSSRLSSRQACMRPMNQPPSTAKHAASSKTVVYLLGQTVFYLANYAYVVLLSNTLAAYDFGRLSLFTAFFMLLSVPTSAIQLLLITYLAKFSRTTSLSTSEAVMALARKYSLGLGCLVVGGYVLAIPLMQQYFRVSSPLPFALLVPTIILLFTSSYAKGILHGLQRFEALGVVMAAEGFAKVGFALLALLFTHSYVASLASLTLSILVSTLIAFLFARNKRSLVIPAKTLAAARTQEMRLFLAQAGLVSAALLVMTHIDVIMANHLLNATDIGTWGLLSVVGKSMIMGGGIITSLFLPSLAAVAGTKKVSSIFRKGFALVSAFVMVCVVATYLFAIPLSRLIAGGGEVIAPWLFTYTVSVGLIALTSYIINSQIVLKEYSFAFPPLVLSLAYAYAVTLFAADLASNLYAYAGFAAALFGSSVVLFALRYAKPHLMDLAGLYKPQYPVDQAAENQLKLLVLNWRDTKHVWAGGAEVYAQELSERWVDEGAHVTLFCSNDLHNKREEIINGVHIIRRGGFVSVYFWAMVYYVLRFRGKFNCIVDCENGIPFFSALYTKTPLILLIHHVHQEIFREHLFPPFSWLAQFLEAHLMPFAYRHAKIVTISESTKRDIRRLGLKVNEVPIVHNGISLATYTPGLKSSNPLVVYVGRLKAYKRLEDLIATARLLHQQVPSVKFVIAGDGEESARLKKLIHLYNLESVVTCKGYVSVQEKIDLYQKAWVVMNPSSMEGWSITTIEANACGTPVVAANVPGLRDSVKHRQTGLLVTLGDIDGYAQALFSLLTNASLRAIMSRSAREWAETFTWEKSAAQFADIIVDHVQTSRREVGEFNWSRSR